jgi:glycosyltransferase involved in cell wall biosynthesis
VKKLSDTRVIFIAGSLGQGGAERQLYYMLQALKASGSFVSVLSLTSGEFWEERIRSLGVDVTWVGRSRGKLARLRSIIRILRRQRPDFVQSQHFFTNLYAVVAGRCAGVLDIGSIRSNARDEVRHNGPIFGPANLRLPRALIVNSRAAIEHALHRNVRPERVHFLANVVDTEEFLPAAQCDERPLHIVSVGRLIRLKRHDMLLQAAARLKDKFGRVIVTIAGAGGLETELRTLGAQLQFGPDLRLVGAIDSASVAQLYRTADVFALTSEYEGTPNALMEAMSAGLPVVATRVGGVPALVQDGSNGLLINAGDVDALTAALEQLATDSDLRRSLGTAARQHIQQTYSVQRLPAALEEIYNAVTA